MISSSISCNTVSHDQNSQASKSSLAPQQVVIQKGKDKIAESLHQVNEIQSRSKEQFIQHDQQIVNDIIMNLETEQDDFDAKLLGDPILDYENNTNQQEQQQELNSTDHHERTLQKPQGNLKQEQQIQHQAKSKPQHCPYPHPLFEILMPQGFKAFLSNPSPKGGMIQCTIEQEHTLIGFLHPKYHLYLSDGHIYMLTAQLKSFHGNIYHFYTDKNQQDEIGQAIKQQNSFEYIFVKQQKSDQIGESQVLGTVTFDFNDIEATGPIQMKTLLEIDNQDLIERALTCVTRQPEWNAKYNQFVVDYYGRVNKPSEHNLQLVEATHDNILLQFGVYDENYNLDFQWPISPLQAFQIAIARIDYKRK